MGHLGLTPQSLHMLGGYRVQARSFEDAAQLVKDARALQDAGCFALVLECVPDAVARTVTDTLDIPTIGIGADRHCDGQVLVLHDLLGMTQGPSPKFVRQYADLSTQAVGALSQFVSDVRDASFPSPAETYHVADDVVDALYGAGLLTEKARETIS